MSRSTTIPPVLKTGALAYIDTLSGLLPCRVLSVCGDNGLELGRGIASDRRSDGGCRVQVVLTADRGAYKRGDVMSDYPARYIVPRAALRTIRRRYYVFPYSVECDPSKVKP